MANVRLNIFENYPSGYISRTARLLGVGSLHILGVEIPGSISFNGVAMPFSVNGTTAKTLSISFGLYSLTGSTLSLANSASVSRAQNNAFVWTTLATSATQDITPGNWYLAIMSSTSGYSQQYFVVNGGIGINAAAPAGVFVRGWLSVSTSAMPASIATTDLAKEGTSNNLVSSYHPYIIISA